jgi:4-oxalocrotonate tautomerase
MPILSIKIPTGHSDESKQTLLKGLTEAVTSSVAAPLHTIRITIDEVSPANTIVAGEIGQPNVIIQVSMIAGRTEALKAQLIAHLSQAVQDTTGISKEHTRVLIQDYPTTDMGVAGGISAKAAGR